MLVRQNISDDYSHLDSSALVFQQEELVWADSYNIMSAFLRVRTIKLPGE